MLFTDKGLVYSDYAVIPFDMESVQVCSKAETKEIDDYEELKEWWDKEK